MGCLKLMYTLVSSLRSVNKGLLVVRKYNLKSYRMRALSAMAPLLRSNLLEDIRTGKSIYIFETKLKNISF